MQMQIDRFIPDIVTMVSSNVISSVISQTGSGKSLRIPSALAENGMKTFVTVPTRTSAISLADFQKTLTNQKIGYAAEGNIRYDNETMVAYVTSGHARRKMLSYFKDGEVRDLDFCDVLMVDEVHSGSIDTSIIIALWIKAAMSGVTVPRLLVASATPVDINISPPPVVYEVIFEKYPIEIYYLEEDLEADSDELYKKSAEYAAAIHNQSDISTGHIIVFVPGKGDVTSVMSQISKLIDTKNVNILPAYGTLDPENMKQIYKETPGKRKIIVATNVAEMSITVSDVGYIIDTMMEKRSETSNSGGLRLVTTYESKDSAIQRAGRTGRTRSGVCYRLCTVEKYNSLEQHRPPEIERVPIHEQVLELIDVGLSPDEILTVSNPQRITDSIKLLNQLGMVVYENGGNARITDIGKFAPRFPLSVRNAAFLWNWIQSELPIFPGVVTINIIDTYGPSYFWLPRRGNDESLKDYNEKIVKYKKEFFDKYRGYSDLETSLNMWSDLIKLDNRPDRYKVIIEKRISTVWAKTNSINNKKIIELINNTNQCVETLIRLGYTVNKGLFTPVNVIKAARPIFLNIYPMLQASTYGSNYINKETGEKYILDSRDAVNKFTEDPPSAIISLISAEIKSRRGAVRIVSFALDTDKDKYGRSVDPTKNVQITQKDAENIDNALALLKNLGIVKDEPVSQSVSESEEYPVVPVKLVEASKPKTPQQKLQQKREYIQTDPPYDYVVKDIIEEHGRDNVVSGFLDSIMSGSIQFPFSSSFGYPAEQLFENLKNTEYDVTQVKSFKMRSYRPKYNSYLPPEFRGVPTILATKLNTFNKIDVLSDYFIEHLRLQAKRYDQEKSVAECWMDSDCVTKVIDKVLEKEHVRPETLREAIYETIMEVTTFKPTWAVALLKLVMGENLQNKKWLDISSGWGDRLLAAMSLDMDYTGFDPNTQLEEPHSQMISMFGDPNKQRIYYGPFEMANLSDDEYDVVLTSTPYFNVEEYVPGQEGQSIVSYPVFEQWMVNFLFIALSKAWNALKPGGYLILHLGDTRDIHIAEPTNIFIESYLTNSSWEGVIGLQSESGYPRPVWVWKKVQDPSTRVIWNPKRNSRMKQLTFENRSLDKTYPEIYKEILKISQ